MSESKHTPGPWKVCGGATPHYKAIHSCHGYIVFGMADSTEDMERDEPIQAPDFETQRANARLIAAAPDLLAMLQRLHYIADHCARADRLRSTCEKWGDWNWEHLRDEAADVIAKATGKDQS